MAHQKTRKGMDVNNIMNKFFDNYKINLALSTFLLLLLVGFLSYNYYTKGDIITRGVDFSGGYQYLFYYNTTQQATSIIEYLRQSYPGIVVQNIEDKKQILVEYHEEIDVNDVEVLGGELAFKRKTSSSLAQTFWKEAVKLLVLAYLLVVIVVFFLFRSFVPSIAVVVAGISDILFAISFMNIAGIPLTMGTLAALLILIGYSVDTDILLTTRTLREKYTTINEALISSMKTGLTMTLTSIVAMSALLVFSTSIELDRIAMVIIAGLVADVLFTWLQNASIMKIYVLRRGGSNR